MALLYWIYNIEMILCVKRIVDCGFPNNTGIDLSGTAREDAIGIRRRMHASCPAGYIQFGSELLICTPDGHWKYNIYCEGSYNNII